MLELGSNRIRLVEGIENLTKLTELWLGRNKITRLVGCPCCIATLYTKASACYDFIGMCTFKE